MDNKEKLIDAAEKQLKEDIDTDDLTAINELLSQVYELPGGEELLKSYLPE